MRATGCTVEAMLRATLQGSMREEELSKDLIYAYFEIRKQLSMRAEGEEKDKAILDLFISDMYYGDWYHNAAIIFFVRTINLAFVTRLRIFQIIGCICVSLSHPISGGMGVVSCGPCDLFDVLHYVSSPCQTTRPRRYSTRTCEESSDV